MKQELGATAGGEATQQSHSLSRPSMKKLALDTEATEIKTGFVIVIIKESGGDERKCYGEKL